MTENKKNKQILNSLKSEDSLRVIDTIKELRESGNSAYIPILIELLHSTENVEIKQRVIKLLSDLKHSDAIPRIIEAIQNKKYASELRDLVAICWENGLDFSQYLSLFVDLVIEEEFLVALEAFTVVENMTGKIEDSYKEEQVQKVKAALSGISEDKRPFLEELIHIIPNIREQEQQ